MKIPGMILGAGACLASVLTSAPVGRAAQIELEQFAPAREAAQAIQAARRAEAEELAHSDLRLARRYLDEGEEAFKRDPGARDLAGTARLFRLAAAQAKVAEARAIEATRKRKAAAAGYQYLDAIDGDTRRIQPAPAPLAFIAADYVRLRREAAEARAARQAAERALEEARSQAR